ncbi:MAG: CRTAC1 family protein [Fuerstiella sp.]
MANDQQVLSKDGPSASPKKKLKRRIFMLLVLVPFMLICGVMTLSYLKSHGQPYAQDIDESLIPTFSPAALNFTHKFDSSSLPMIGSCILDIDGDRVPELFLGGGKDQGDAIFRYSDGKFVPIENCAGIDKTMPDATYGAATVDADADGDSDLFVARDSGVTYYENTNGTFSGTKLDIPFDEKSTPLSFAFADLNSDGAIDMFVSAYLPKAKMEGMNIFNKENYGGNSLLLLNNGDNTFTDITDDAGMRYTHNTFQGVFVDMDGDMQQDLVVAHDTGQVKTWRNLGNLKFEDSPNPTSGVYGYPMGIAVADYDNNGLVDFFFSNTGGTAPHFLAKGDLTEDQVFEDKLIFFRNDGDFKFTNINEETKTAKYEFSWGTVFHDLNLDGRQDLVISQNFVDFPLHKMFKLPGRVLIQRPDGTFAATEDRSGVVNRRYEITALMADFNSDGYPDMVRVNLAGEALAFINDGGENHYLKVRVPDTPASMGAKVSVTTGDGRTLTDWLISGEGLVCDQTHVLTFGLGTNQVCPRIQITYMDGRTQTIENPTIDSLIEVEPPAVAATEGVDANE